MKEQHPSFMRSIRAKLGHHTRSISQPPTYRSIEWTTVPVEYRPRGQLETNVVKSDWPTMRTDLPARYHSNPIQQEIKRASTPSAPMLQLPRPRAMWRRWRDPDLEAQRITFNIACALPPHYLQQPPAYLDEDEEEKISVDRQEWSPLHSLYTGHAIPFSRWNRCDTDPTDRTFGR